MSTAEEAVHGEHVGRGPEVCVAAVAQRGDELLMVRRGPGRAAGEWSLPGGPVTAGETMAEAVVSRLCEQTGHRDVLCGPFMGWSELIDDTGATPHRVVMYFTAVVMDVEPVVAVEPGSAAEARWTPTWQVPELRLADGLAEVLADHDLIDTVV